MAQPTFEDCRRNAYRLLGDAADWLRYIDAPAAPEQREAALDAIRLIGEAKDKLNGATR